MHPNPDANDPLSTRIEAFLNALDQMFDCSSSGTEVDMIPWANWTCVLWCNFWVETTSQGQGRTAMRMILELADRHQVDLVLTVVDDDPVHPPPIPAPDLIRWYERCGFIVQRKHEDCTFMRRSTTSGGPDQH